MLAFALLCLAGSYFLFRARHLRHHIDVLATVPTYGLAEALAANPEGALAVRANAMPYGSTRLEAPASGRPCVWWGLRLRGHQRLWHRLSHSPPRERTSPHPFLLADGDHRVRIDPEGLMTYGHPHSFHISEKLPMVGPAPPVMQRVRAALPDVSGWLRVEMRRVDFTEWLIEENEEVTVTGALDTDPHSGEAVIKAHAVPGSRGKIFSLTPSADHTTVDDMRRSRRRSLFVGLGFLVFGGPFLLLSVTAFVAERLGLGLFQ